jgi:farnesyl-diphosphate farnesyltransferase
MSQTEPTDEIGDLLQKTSRTFALTIPLLPEPTRTEVGIAYLLFRIIDTFEDATQWTPDQRIEALGRFVELLDGPPAASAWMVEQCAREPPIEHAGYRELLAKIPAVLTAFQRLQIGARAPIRKHLARSAEGMSGFVARGDGPNGLQLGTLDDLRDYCYVVAGIVGEMLTELFVLGRPSLAPVAEELRNRAAQFGEGLQLVNILKDVRPDAAEGRVYLPRKASTREVFELTEEDLAVAGEYTELLRTGGAERGLVGFNAFIVKLAVGTLQLLREQGFGAKLSRLQVAKIAAEVTHAIGQGRPLFEPRGLSIAG